MYMTFLLSLSHPVNLDFACPAQPFRVKFWHLSLQMFRVLTGKFQWAGLRQDVGRQAVMLRSVEI